MVKNGFLKFLWRAGIFTAVAFSLTACGGGGGGKKATARAQDAQATSVGTPAASQPQAATPPVTAPPANNASPMPAGGNNPPDIAGQPPALAKIGARYTFAPKASDPDGDGLSFEVRNLPDWATFDSETGRLSGIPPIGSAGVYGDIEILVTDGSRSDTTGPFTVTVVQTASASISLSWEPPTLNEDGSPLFDLDGYRIYFGRQSGQYEASIEIDNPGITTVVIDELIPATYFIAATSVNTRGVESDLSGEVIAVAR